MSRVRRRKPKKKAHKKAPEKKGMSKQMLMTIVIGGLMILSVFGIMFSSFNSGSERRDYGDYRFQTTSNGWAATIDGQRVEFTYHPEDLEEMELSSAVVDKLKGSKVMYMTFDPNSSIVGQLELMRFEMAKSMNELFDVYPMPGVTTPSNTYSHPVVDCYNATMMVPVVNLVESNQTKAWLDGDCIMLEVDEFSTLVMKDRILYAMLGILP